MGFLNNTAKGGEYHSRSRTILHVQRIFSMDIKGFLMEVWLLFSINHIKRIAI